MKTIATFSLLAASALAQSDVGLTILPLTTTNPIQTNLSFFQLQTTFRLHLKLSFPTLSIYYLLIQIYEPPQPCKTAHTDQSSCDADKKTGTFHINFQLHLSKIQFINSTIS